MAVLMTVVAFALLLQSELPLSAAPAAPKPGSARRTFNFPKQFSLGTLSLVPFGSKSSLSYPEPLTAACANVTVTVPLDRWLMFEPNRKGFENPQLLDAVGAEKIDAVAISIIALDDSEAGMCERFLLHLNQFKNLKALVLDHSDVSDKVMLELKDQPNLALISANLCYLTGEWFKGLKKFPNLTRLSVQFAPLAPGTLCYLSQARKLDHLDVRHAHIDDAGLKCISTSCPAITILEIAGNPQVTDAGLKYLSNLPHLTELDISDTGVTAKGLNSICSLKLRNLTVSAGTFSEHDLNSLRHACREVGIRSKDRSPDLNTKELFAPLH